ncbi:MAG: 50S ribosomal protein L23 [Leptonema sp. (in: Bacteria)]|nr:50S ribosomal protein L23 [Leptonema sp. (in: bacteria)]
MDLNQVLIMPYITEKTEALKAQSADSQVIVFRIRKDANKELVRQAIKKIYDVGVEKVNIINTSSKSGKFRNVAIRKSGFKKAIVTLERGKTIDLSK